MLAYAPSDTDAPAPIKNALTGRVPGRPSDAFVHGEVVAMFALPFLATKSATSRTDGYAMRCIRVQ